MMPSWQLFLDMDGVLADLAAGYFAKYGVAIRRDAPDPPGLKQNIGAPGFFRDLPMMPDARRLWNAARLLHPAPAVLTAVPRTEAADAPAQKAAWIAEKFGTHVRVVTCYSNQKGLHGQPGDVLIDDWSRHRRPWERMGGIFIHHRSAHESIEELRDIVARKGR